MIYVHYSLKPEDVCDSHRFAVGILARHFACSPREVGWQRDAHGKPVLPFWPGWHCSLTHTRSLVALAYTKDRRIGIDVEPLHRSLRTDPHRLAARFFSSEEAELLRQSENPRGLFVRYWVAKEALVKGKGIGLYQDLKSTRLDVEGIAFSAKAGAGAGGSWRTMFLR